jgi:hypothetical protein
MASERKNPWNLTVRSKWLMKARSDAENHKNRDLLRKKEIIAICRGRCQISRFVAVNAKYRDSAIRTHRDKFLPLVLIKSTQIRADKVIPGISCLDILWSPWGVHNISSSTHSCEN